MQHLVLIGSFVIALIVELLGAPPPPLSQNVNVFGARAFKEVLNIQRGHEGGP